MAHADYFLKIDGITGESTGKGHEGSIELDSWSWGLANRTTGATGTGRATGRAQFTGFTFGAASTKASPQMMSFCASGKHIKEAVLSGSRTGGEGGNATDFLKIKFSDVLISSYQESAASEMADFENNSPMDQVTLNFAKIEFTYTSQSPTGGLGEPTTSGFDLEKDQGF